METKQLLVDNWSPQKSWETETKVSNDRLTEEGFLKMKNCCTIFYTFYSSKLFVIKFILSYL
jgi:hypothetical protein